MGFIISFLSEMLFIALVLWVLIRTLGWFHRRFISFAVLIVVCSGGILREETALGFSQQRSQIGCSELLFPMISSWP